MKKIWLFWWIFWLFYSFEAVGLELVEAGSKPTFKSKDVSISKSCGPGGCTTHESVYQHKEWDRRGNNYGGGLYSYPSSGGSSGANTMDLDLTPAFNALFKETFGLPAKIIGGIGCLFGGCSSSSAERPAISSPAPEQEKIEPRVQEESL